MAVETALAKHHWDRVKSRDRTLTYNKKDRKALDELTPGLRLDGLVRGRRAPRASTRSIVRQPDYFTAMAKAARRGPARRLEDLAELARAPRRRARS